MKANGGGSSDLTSIVLLGLYFAWLILNLILSSRLAEYRIDSASIAGGMNNDLPSLKRRFSSANYSEPGKRLLAWLKFSMIAQFIVFAIWILIFPPS